MKRHGMEIVTDRNQTVNVDFEKLMDDFQQQYKERNKRKRNKNKRHK